jgi:hypothetical protein
VSESPSRLSHRLSVVWFTDLVGYSTLAVTPESTPGYATILRNPRTASPLAIATATLARVPIR